MFSKEILRNIKEITTASLEPYEQGFYLWFTIFLTIWVSLVFNFYRYPPLAFLVSHWLYEPILLATPFIILFIYFSFYYKFIFKKIILTDESYYFNSTGINEFIKSPELILNENIISRFSFKLKLYGNMPSKFKKNKLVLLIRKAPTINISIGPTRTALEQTYENYNEEIFYVEQNYELLSPYVSFSIYVESENAVDTKELEIYVLCKTALANFLKNMEKDPKLCKKNLIHKEEFYLSK